jgi:hypothetical protein
VGRFGNWLSRAKAVQAEVYGQDASAMGDHDWAAYQVTNLHAAHVELGEVAQEFSLKSWRGIRRPTQPERERALVEIVDALCHISNVLVAIDVTDEELNEAYDRKVSFTRRRDG